MVNLRQVYHISMDALRRCVMNPRIYISVLLVAVLIEPLISPIGAFAGWAGVPSAPWLFPFLTQHYYIQTILLFGAVLLFCDAPFMNEGTPYLLIRAGRKNWFWGQIGYVFSASFVYFLLIIAVSVLFLLPNVTFSLEWGKVLKTLTHADSALQVGTNQLDARLQNSYTPVSAMLLSFFVSWLNGVLIGVMIFFVNLHTKRSLGAVAGAVLAVLPYLAVSFSDMYALYFFAPGTWMNIVLFSDSKMPGLLYAVLFMSAAVSLLILFSYLSMLKRTIDVMPTI